MKASPTTGNPQSADLSLSQQNAYDRQAFRRLMTSPTDDVRLFFIQARALVQSMHHQQCRLTDASRKIEASAIPSLDRHPLVRTVRALRWAGWTIDRGRSASAFHPQGLIVLRRGETITYVGFDGVER